MKMLSLASRATKLEAILHQMQNDMVGQTENIGILFDSMSKCQTYAAKAAPNRHGVTPGCSRNVATGSTAGVAIYQSQAEKVRNVVHSPNQQARELPRRMHGLAEKANSTESTEQQNQHQPPVAGNSRHGLAAGQDAHAGFQLSRHDRRRIIQRKRRDRVEVGKKNDARIKEWVRKDHDYCEICALTI